jgi:membrane associated rhomboid family serine protease/Zn-finger nucleic acid-binding protein
MFICPNCHVQMSKVTGNPDVFWRCHCCDGRSATVALLRRTIPRDVVNALWQKARFGEHPHKRHCPACNRLMAEVPASAEGSAPYLDVCTACHFVWFDSSEYDSLPVLPRDTKGNNSLPQEAREKIAVLELDAIRQQAKESDWEQNAPDEWWQWIPAVLGMPVEHDSEPVQQSPWITWSLSLAILAVSLIAFTDFENVVHALALIPAHYGRYAGLTFLTSFFLHGGGVHLFGNLYFFLVLGDNVEDWLGKHMFLLLLFSATLAGGILHTIGDPRSTIPCIGASGGISGIIAFYALKFPRARLGILVRFYLMFRWVRIPAYAMFILWLLLQVWGVYAQISGFSNVSSLAHLGGAATGFLFWFFTRDKNRPAKQKQGR